MSEHRLRLEIELPSDFYVGAETQQEIDAYADGDTLFVVTEEWMRRDVGVTFVSIPGEKNLSSDFEVHSLVCRIVAASIVTTTKDGAE